MGCSGGEQSSSTASSRPAPAYETITISDIDRGVEEITCDRYVPENGDTAHDIAMRIVGAELDDEMPSKDVVSYTNQINRIVGDNEAKDVLSTGTEVVFCYTPGNG